MKKKDASQANIAFFCGLFCWVPLFSLFTNAFAFVFGIIALYNIHKNPKEYGGFKRAVFGITMAVLWGGLFIYGVQTRGLNAILGR